MMRTKIWLVGFGLSLVACNTTKKDCEHAKKAFADMNQKQFDEAMLEVSESNRAKFKADFDSSMDKGNAKFNERCEALDKESLACIARWDEFQAHEDERRKKGKLCAELPLEKAKTCFDEAKAASSTKIGPCEAKLEAFIGSVYE